MQAGADADGLHALLHLVDIAADGHVLAFPALDGVALGELVEALGIHQQDVSVANGGLEFLAQMAVVVLCIAEIIGMIELLDTDTCAEIGESVDIAIAAGTIVEDLSIALRRGGILKLLPVAAAIGYAGVEARLAAYILLRHIHAGETAQVLGQFRI